MSDADRTASSAAPASPELAWRCCRFEALGVHELERIFAARQRVFVIEQQCLYQDADGCDEFAWHLAAWSTREREPLAYARILDPGIKYAEPSIGRVITTPPGRGRGLGHEVLRRAVAACRTSWPAKGIRISAQTRLEGFYAGFGFAVVGVPYLEDGIDHTEMVLAPG